MNERTINIKSSLLEIQDIAERVKYTAEALRIIEWDTNLQRVHRDHIVFLLIKDLLDASNESETITKNIIKVV